MNAAHRATRLSIELTSDPRAPEAARAWLRAIPMPSELRDDALLILSELVTNSVRHAGLAPHERITVACERWEDMVRLEVHDPGPGIPRRSVGPRDPGRPGGRGLDLVEQLSARWGAERGVGSRVWAEIRA